MNLLTIAVLLTGVVTVGLGFWKQRPVAVHVTYSQVYTAPDGTQVLHAVIERTQVGRDWKEVQTYYDASGRVSRVSRLYAVDGRGLLKVDEARKQLRFLGAHHAEHKFPFSEANTKADTNFIGEDKVLGYRTLVLRFDHADGGNTEEHFAPELDGVALKRVFNSSDSSTTIQATKVEMSTASVAEMAAEIPNYPIVKKKKE